MQENRKKILIDGYVEVKVGEKIVLTLNDQDGNSTTVLSDGIISEATNKSIDKEGLSKNIIKTGDTPFQFENLDIDIEGNCFVPVSVINDLRRNAITNLTEKRAIRNADRYFRMIKERENAIIENVETLETVETDVKKVDNVKSDSIESCNDESSNVEFENLKTCSSKIYIRLSDVKVLEAISGDLLNQLEKFTESKIEPNSYVYAIDYIIDRSFDNTKKTKLLINKLAEIKAEKQSFEEIWIVLPNILKDNESEPLNEIKSAFFDKIIDGVVVNSWGELNWARENNLVFRVGSGLNTFNSNSLNYLTDALSIELSEELTLKQITEIKNDHSKIFDSTPILDAMIYGRTKLMSIEHCPFEEDGCNADCSVLAGVSLKDNTGRSFPVRRSIGHRLQILNGDVLNVMDRLDAFKKAGINNFIIDIRREDIDREVSFTRGHYFRGVE